jgi:glycosyltransferase involved in cell wall biosynthesis
MKGTGPVVSIIIATYNSGKTLKETLKSVQSQVFQDWECIVVDGDSKDNTISIIVEFVKDDSRFRYISEPDKGIYDAFNKGWKLSKGEWVYYLGSSDILLPDGLEKLMEEEHPDAAIVSGHIYAQMIDGTTKLAYSRGWRGSHQAKITRRTVIEKYGGFDDSFRIVADEDLICKIRYSGLKLDNVDVFVAKFSVDGMSSKFKSVYYKGKELYRVYKKYPNSIKHPLLRALGITVKAYRSIIYRKTKKLLFS